MTYYLADTENIHKEWYPFSKTAQAGDAFLLFYSRNVEPMSMQMFGPACLKGVRFDFIECFTGHNAMDFQLCTELGRLIALHPDEKYVILSKDTGFDPVVRYWKARNVQIQRIDTTQNDTDHTVKAEYRNMIQECGLEDEDITIAVAIMFEGMKQPQNRQKKNIYNRFQTKYGRDEGLAKYKAVRPVILEIAAHGPYPPKSETKPQTAAKPQTHAAPAQRPAPAADTPEPTESQSPPKKAASNKGQLSKMVKQFIPNISPLYIQGAAKAVNECKQVSGITRQQVLKKLEKHIGKKAAGHYVDDIKVLVEKIQNSALT